MKDSLFVFQKGAIDSSSVTENNLGTNLDFFAVPTSSLTSISALEGKIVLYFKSSNVFENSKANQAKVTLNTTQGLEPRAAIATWNLTLEEGQVYVFDDVGSIYPSSYSDSISGIDSIIRPTTERFTGGGGGATTIDVLSSTDVVLGTLDASVPDTVKLMSAIMSYSKVGTQGQITSSAASPSGIAYQNSRPMSAISYSANDSVDSFTDGDYDHTNPVYPASYAKVDYNATQADVRATPASGTLSTDSVGQTMLEENNAFGNKFRYTDDAGNPSDAAVGSNLWAHVDWNNHSWTGATNYYVIDHLENWGMTVQYADDSGTVNLNGSNDWAAWLTYISTVTWQGTYSGFIPLDMGDVSNAHGAKCSPNEVWADAFFEFDASVSGSSRGAFLTGESYDASNFYPIYDSGNADLVIEITKSIASGFQSRLTNVFMKRKHY